MKFLIKKALASALSVTGITALARKLSSTDEITVLMYHKVNEENFEKQIKYIKKNYNPIAEQDLYDYNYKKKDLPKNSVLITFDDGYLNNYTQAWPILKKYNVPATIFLVTGLIGKKEMAWFDKIEYIIENSKKESIQIDGKKYKLNKKGKEELLKKCYYYAITIPEDQKNSMLQDLLEKSEAKIPQEIPQKYAFMNWKQAKEMMPLVTFGSHTHTHPILPNLPFEKKKEEMKKSREEIKKNLGKYPISICYPNGDYDEETMRAAKESGFLLGYSSNFGRNTRKISTLAIQRIGANINDTPEIIYVKLTNLSSIFQKSKTKSHFKVIMVTNYYYPQTGGITTVVDMITRNLKRSGINTKILAYPHSFRKLENSFNNSKFIHKTLVIFFIAYASAYALTSRIFNKKVIIHSHSANFCAIIGLVGEYFGCKTIHTFHTHLDMAANIGETSPKQYLEKIDQLTAVSESLGKSYSERYKLKTKIRTIYNGAPETKNKEKRKSDGTIRALFVGHLFEIKDPLLFVKTIHHASKKNKIEARIIGEGPLLKDIEDYIENNNIKNITLLGHADKQTVEENYKWADVLVLTSKAEGFAVVLLEAMSAGVPVVSTNFGGTEEIISDGEDGLIVKDRNPESITKAIIKATKNSEILASNAQHKIENNFIWKKICVQYTNIYKQLTQEKTYKSSEENVQ